MSRKEECLFTIPPFFWLLFFFLVPTIIIFIFAFKPSDPYGGVGEGWTVDGILSLLKASNVTLIFRTFTLSFFTMLFCLLLGIPTGYAIARMQKKYRYLVLLLIILPFWSSYIVRVYAWKSLLHPEGVVKQFLVFFHLAKSDAVLLYNPSTVVLVMVYSYLPFAILPIYSSAAKFDFSLIEAGMDLGLNRFRVFYKVFIPGIRRGILTAMFLVFIPVFGEFVIPDLVGGIDSQMIGNKIMVRTFAERNIPHASALSVFVALVVLVPLVTAMLWQFRANKSHPVRGGH